MRKGVFKFTAAFFAILPFIIASCMDTESDVPDFNEQLQKDLAAIDAYIVANNIENVEQDTDGLLRYVIHRAPGTGIKPTIDSCVTANYAGKLMTTGTEFDKGTNISFPIGGVIDGWKIGIPLLHVGDSATLYIPSGLAYGYYGYPPDIPKNANLIFNVGLTKVGSDYKSSDRSCD